MVIRMSLSIIIRGFAFLGLLVLLGGGPAFAQVLVAYDDHFGIPFGEPLVVEFYGILDNDILDDQSAGENGATAELVTDVSHGILTLNPNGSFNYSPDETFDGTDSFVYSAVFAAVSDQATVTLSACDGGPDIFTCWNETAFLAKAAEWGLASFQEGFEDDAAWGLARSPMVLPVVNSQGIQWMTNHPDAPANNDLTTGPGPARTGEWGVFDPRHGYATGSEFECDVDNPDTICLYFDGFSGIREPVRGVLNGVGGYITGSYGGRVDILLDEVLTNGGGRITPGHQFFGVIDTRPAGFTQFEFREVDGKVGQALFIFGDDFTMLTPAPSPVEDARTGSSKIYFAGAGPNPSNGRTSLRFSTPAQGDVQLVIYDVRGRLVRSLTNGTRGVGTHIVDWDGRDRDGRNVPAGTYFGLLRVDIDGKSDTQVRKMVIAH
jgi:VCBS repeat-containing protein